MKTKKIAVSIQQIDAALALLDWSTLRLAQAVKCTPQTIRNLRRDCHGVTMVHPHRAKTFGRIKVTLEENGIRFLKSGGVEPINQRKKETYDQSR
jgi:hypothetical protein